MKNEQKLDESSSQFLLYQSQDGQIKVQVKIKDETVWLTQKQMAELFGTTKQNISLHIQNIFSEGELEENSVIKEFLTTAIDGKRYETQFYNLDMIISVGYRVNSMRGTQFRIWATKRLREYIIKGFVLDDGRLEDPQRNNYYSELIERVRKIRTSERNFYQKITDLYATSVDYDPKNPLTRNFFATVQNKMHYGIHGRTAAEIIAERADADRPNMGITSIPKNEIRKSDACIAKNYLTEKELRQLDLIVDQYLSFAELRALNNTSMSMEDWIRKLDDFLRFNEKEILEHHGNISKEIADQKAEHEFKKFINEQDKAIQSDFDRVIEKFITPPI